MKTLNFRRVSNKKKIKLKNNKVRLNSNKTNKSNLN